MFSKEIEEFLLHVKKIQIISEKSELLSENRISSFSDFHASQIISLFSLTRIYDPTTFPR